MLQPEVGDKDHSMNTLDIDLLIEFAVITDRSVRTDRGVSFSHDSAARIQIDVNFLIAASRLFAAPRPGLASRYEKLADESDRERDRVGNGENVVIDYDDAKEAISHVGSAADFVIDRCNELHAELDKSKRWLGRALSPDRETLIKEHLAHGRQLVGVAAHLINALGSHFGITAPNRQPRMLF